MADHADSRTTKLYDRRGQKVLREDVERIRYACSQSRLALLPLCLHFVPCEPDPHPSFQRLRHP